MPPIYNWDVLTETYGAYLDKFRGQGWIVVPGPWPKKPVHPRLLLTPLEKAQFEDSQEFDRMLGALPRGAKPIPSFHDFRSRPAKPLVHQPTYEACLTVFECTWGIRKVDRTGRFNIKSLEKQS